MKKFLFGLTILLVGIFVSYKILSGITKREIDKTVEVAAPTSPKSAPEYYAFGYQPALIYSENREDCQDRRITKRALFGDLHIHTALSADAFPDGTRTFPDDVYQFAKGNSIEIPSPDGTPRQTLQLERPLDFAAVTDHAETWAEGHICRSPDHPSYDTKSCQTFRAGGEMGVRVFMQQNGRVFPQRDKTVCGENYEYCLEADKSVWQDIIRAAETAYDKSETCEFTSFVGYEYTRAPNAQHMHRNTIFKNANVPDRAASFFTHPNAHSLLSSFETECRLGIEACDVLSIPHNSNISGGNAFNPRALEGFSLRSQQSYRELRNAYDRLAEIFQHKGASECLNGVTDILGDVDELCDVEAIRQFGKPERDIRVNTILMSLSDSDSPECTDDHMDPKDNTYKGFCLSSRDFARGALLEGMTIEGISGTNPYEFGFIGSSDTHISIAGATTEPDWEGHIAYETSLQGRLGQAALGRFNRLVSNPGGLAGVYAIENSRDAIFQSMKRREAFATSGPRIEPRFFAGHFEENLCEQEDWLTTAYRDGTPMGSKLPAQIDPFSIIAQAKRDVASQPLERLQLIKGWIDQNGVKHNKVIDLQVSEAGADNLCAVYTDPDYDPDIRTYYYVRAVEPTSPRWSAAQCQALPIEDRPETCENDLLRVIYEMAWTSPIWLTPNYQPPLPVDLQ